MVGEWSCVSSDTSIVSNDSVNRVNALSRLNECICLITKICLYNFDPLKPLFLKSKTWVNRGIHFFFLLLIKDINCGYSLELPCRGSSNEYPQSMF